MVATIKEFYPTKRVVNLFFFHRWNEKKETLGEALFSLLPAFLPYASEAVIFFKIIISSSIKLIGSNKVHNSLIFNFSS